jgi:hypothetical protein
MRKCGGALLSVIVIHHKARVNDAWNPAEQRQNNAEKEARNSPGQEYRKRRKYHTKKISQRFHLFFLLADL